MAWPAELASLGVVTARRTPPPRRPRRGPTSRVLDATRFRRRYVVEARGLWRIFGPAVYRFYRNQARPPRQGDTPFATSATLPHEPARRFAFTLPSPPSPTPLPRFPEDRLPAGGER